MRRGLTVLVLLLAGQADAAAPPGVRRDAWGDPLPAGAVARLGSVRLRHDRVNKVAISPDGRLIASAGDDIRLWDRASGRLLAVTAAHPLTSKCLTFTADGKKLLVAEGRERPDSSAALWLWDVASGERRTFWDAPPSFSSPIDLRFNRDGKTLAVSWWVAKEDEMERSQVVLFDFVARKPRGTLKHEGDPRGWMEFSHDGNRLCYLVSGDKGHLHVYDVPAARELKRIELCTDVRPLAISPVAGKVALLKSDRVEWLDLDSGKCTRAGFVCSVPSPLLQFSRDGKELLCVGESGRIATHDVATGKQTREVVPKGDDAPEMHGVQAVTLSEDGRWRVVVGDSCIRVTDVRTGKLVPKFDYAGTYAEPSPDGRRAVTWSHLGLDVWDAESGKRLRRVPAWSAEGAFRWTKDGKSITCAHEGRYRWYDAGSGDLWRSLELPKGVSWACLTSDGSRVCWVRRDEGESGMSSASSGKTLSRWTAKGIGALQPVESRYLFAVSRDENRTLFLEWDRQHLLRVRDAADKVLSEMPPRKESESWTANHLLTGRLFITSSSSGIDVWDVDAKRRRAHVRDEGEWNLGAVTLSPDERTLVAIRSPDPESDETPRSPHCRLIEVATGLVRYQFSQDALFQHAAFTPDGRRLITTGDDALVWHVAGLAGRVPTDRAWADLGSADGRAAFAAVHSLAERPREAVPLLAAWAKTPAPDVKQVRAWIADLGSESFERRADAEARLAALGDRAEGELLLAEKQKLDLESKTRVRRLLRQVESSPAYLRGLRAVEVLEAIAAPEATKLLAALAAGGAGERLTAEAKRALGRVR